MPKTGPDFPEIDLHNLRSAEARRCLEAGLAALRRTSPGASVRIITGQGNRSARSAVLAPMVEALLRNGSLSQVVAWEKAADGGSFTVRLAGGGGRDRRAVTRAGEAEAKALRNARALERAHRKARRDLESAADEATETRRLENLRREYGGRELPDWLKVPPADLVRARDGEA